MDFRFGEAGSGIGKAKLRATVLLRENQADLILSALLLFAFCSNRIHGILQQLTHEHIGGAVKMIRENVDHSAEIHLKYKIILRHSLLPPSFSISDMRIITYLLFSVKPHRKQQTRSAKNLCAPVL